MLVASINIQALNDGYDVKDEKLVNMYFACPLFMWKFKSTDFLSPDPASHVHSDCTMTKALHKCKLELHTITCLCNGKLKLPLSEIVQLWTLMQETFSDIFN